MLWLNIHVACLLTDEITEIDEIDEVTEIDEVDEVTEDKKCKNMNVESCIKGIIAY